MSYTRVEKSYTRVEIFLPLNSTTLPKSLSIRAELRDKFGGLTSTRIKYPTEFVGWYIEEKNNKKKVYRDDIIWFMVDVDIMRDPDFVNYFLNFKSVKEMELQEGELWIVYYPVSRFTLERDKVLK